MPKGKGKATATATNPRRSARQQKLQLVKAHQDRHSQNLETRRNAQHDEAIALSMFIRKLHAYEPGLVENIRTIAQDESLARAIDATTVLQKVNYPSYLRPDFDRYAPGWERKAKDTLATAVALSKPPLVIPPHFLITPADYKKLWAKYDQRVGQHHRSEPTLGRLHFDTGTAPRQNTKPLYTNHHVNPYDVMEKENAFLWNTIKTIQALQPTVTALPVDPLVADRAEFGTWNGYAGGRRTRRRHHRARTKKAHKKRPSSSKKAHKKRQARSRRK